LRRAIGAVSSVVCSSAIETSLWTPPMGSAAPRGPRYGCLEQD
jgi:hypothetical protein